MRWEAALSTAGQLDAALAAALDGLERGLEGAEPDLLFAFVSAHHAAGFPELGERLLRRHPDALILGCSARSVIGAGREVETGPGLALLGAHLPGVELAPLRIAEGWSAGEEEPPAIGAAPREAAGPHLLLLTDPFTCDAEPLVQALDESLPGAVKVGGLASGGAGPGENALWLGGDLYRGGAVGVALAGDLEVDAVVAQGCRPVGAPMFVTRCRERWILELDGRPPLDVLQGLHDASPPADRELMRGSLFLGVEMRSGESAYGQGDFLVRNLLGADPDRGAVAVGANLRELQVVQFHLRDAATSSAELAERLERYRRDRRGGEPPAGALLFSCVGRGMQLYGRPDHDTDAFRAALGEVPLAGFFCNGEIGPVQGRTFLHGYTSAFSVFRPRRAEGGSAAC